jgi:hypothetical protein
MQHTFGYARVSATDQNLATEEHLVNALPNERFFHLYPCFWCLTLPYGTHMRTC